ncbi:hypothetical protein [Shewanella avicenniae]|nr:hypothetical protein [Shewanella avicenniae]
MLAFLRKNIGLIILAIVLFGGVFGGIYYVEHSLSSQERVIN